MKTVIRLTVEDAETTDASRATVEFAFEREEDAECLGLAIAQSVNSITIARQMQALAHAVVIFVDHFSEVPVDGENAAFVNSARELVDFWSNHDAAMMERCRNNAQKTA